MAMDSLSQTEGRGGEAFVMGQFKEDQTIINFDRRERQAATEY